MADAIAGFFEALGSRGHVPSLGRATGTVRFELRDGRRRERWLVRVTKGEVEVSREEAPADLVVRADRALFERIARGRANAMAAVLRGELAIEGGTGLLVLFQRLLPRPRDARRTRAAAGYARRRG